MMTKLNCQHCAAELSINTDTIACPRCQQVGLVSEPLYVLNNHQAITKQASFNWLSYVRKHYQQQPDKSWLNNATFAGNSALACLTGLNKQSRVLNFGCQLGNDIGFLAEHCAELYVLDSDLTKLAVAMQRYQQESAKFASPIHYICCDYKEKLPFKMGYFDLIYLSNDWWLSLIENQNAEVIAESTITEYLRQLALLLRPGGQVLIPLDNGLNYRQLSLTRLKRFIADCYGQLIAGNNELALTSLYSRHWQGYLIKAGFADVRQYRINTSNQSLWQITWHYHHFITQLLRTLSVKKAIKTASRFSPGVALVASKQPVQALSVFEQVQTQAQQLLNEQTLTLSDAQITGKAKIVFEAQGQTNTYIIKIPLDRRGILAERHNHQVLMALAQSQQSDILFPRSYELDQHTVVEFFLETKVDGQPLRKVISQERRADFAKPLYLTWLRLNKAGLSTKLMNFEQRLFEQFVKPRAASIFTVTEYQTELKQLLGYLSAQLVDTKVMFGLQHGDFSASNILLEQGLISGVIDWESSDLSGMVILDLLNIYASVERCCCPQTNIVDNINDMLSEQWHCPEEWHHIEQGFEFCQIAKDKRKAYMILLWFWMVSELLLTDVSFNPDITADRIDKFLINSKQWI